MIKRRVTGVNYVLNFNRQKATLNYHPITEKQAIELVGFLDDLEVSADEVKFTYRLYQADKWLICISQHNLLSAAVPSKVSSRKLAT